jgi:hypothetical protein
MSIDNMPRLLSCTLLVFIFLVTNASGQVLYYCSIEQQSHWSCCCEGMDETDPCHSLRKAECCCDIQLVASEPLRLSALPWESPSLPSVLLTPSWGAGQMAALWNPISRWKYQKRGSFQTAPPIFLQNCSYLI